MKAAPKRKRKTTRPKARNWIFTDYGGGNPKLWNELPKGVKYVTHQLEKCPTSGRLHVQGYLQLEKPQQVTFLQKLRKCSWMIAKGSLASNQKYTQKGPTSVSDPVVLGTPSKQGQRTDLVAFRALVKEGKNRRHLWDEFPSLMARHRHLYSDLSALVIPPRKKRTVYVFFGDPRTGKTKYVWDNHEDRYSIPYGDKVWCSGYDGHDTVLWDDFAGRASKVPLVLLLQILDNYPLQLEIKGGHVWFNPSTLYITTNIAPGDWYDYSNREPHRLALASRVAELWTFTSQNVSGTDSVQIVKYKTQSDIIKFF